VPYGVYNTSLAHNGRARAMRILRDRGFIGAEVEFAGGHDEGGVDAIYGISADGARVEIIPHPATSWEHGEDGTWGEVPKERTQKQIDEDVLHETLGLPVYERYSTFAGEFYVTGKVIWDVKADTVVMEGSEEIPRSESVDGSW
jgi:hypothetical protein